MIAMRHLVSTIISIMWQINPPHRGKLAPFMAIYLSKNYVKIKHTKTLQYHAKKQQSMVFSLFKFAATGERLFAI